MRKEQRLFKSQIVGTAIKEAFLKLDPRIQIKKPVMFVVLVGSILTLALFVRSFFVLEGESPVFILLVSIWLWFTVLFANFAEAIAEGRGKAQAEALRQSRKDVTAKKLSSPDPTSSCETVSSASLKKGDIVL